MEIVILSLIAGFAGFVVAEVIASRKSGFKEAKLQSLENEIDSYSQSNPDENDIISTTYAEASGFNKILLSIPFISIIYNLFVRAGYREDVKYVFIIVASLFAVTFIFLSIFISTIFSLAGALIVSIMLPKKYLEGKLKKRRHKFIDMFPDVLDMFVRSLRSGFPVNTSIKMIAQSMEDPVKTEFQRIADEVAYGRSLSNSLYRMSQRIEESDVRFFVVCLAVQQETGGNLAEIINNLANVIRKRRQLRLKVRAITAEGRTTGWILGSLPVLLFIALFIMVPEHLEPLFETTQGNYLLAISGGLILLAAWIISKIIDIET